MIFAIFAIFSSREVFESRARLSGVASRAAMPSPFAFAFVFAFRLRVCKAGGETLWSPEKGVANDTTSNQRLPNSATAV